MISAKFLWGNVLMRGKLQMDANISNFDIFESALYLRSVSMPLMTQVSNSQSQTQKEYQALRVFTIIIKCEHLLEGKHVISLQNQLHNVIFSLFSVHKHRLNT